MSVGSRTGCSRHCPRPAHIDQRDGETRLVERHHVVWDAGVGILLQSPCSSRARDRGSFASGPRPSAGTRDHAGPFHPRPPSRRERPRVPAVDAPARAIARPVPGRAIRRRGPARRRSEHPRLKLHRRLGPPTRCPTMASPRGSVTPKDVHSFFLPGQPSTNATQTSPRGHR